MAELVLDHASYRVGFYFDRPTFVLGGHRGRKSKRWEVPNRFSLLPDSNRRRRVDLEILRYRGSVRYVLGTPHSALRTEVNNRTLFQATGTATQPTVTRFFCAGSTLYCTSTGKGNRWLRKTGRKPCFCTTTTTTTTTTVVPVSLSTTGARNFKPSTRRSVCDQTRSTVSTVSPSWSLGHDWRRPDQAKPATMSLTPRS